MKKKDLILLIGPAASGKGSLADRLEDEGYERLTMSNILRKYNVPIPKVGLVADEIVIGALKKALEDSSGTVVLDGFPRTENQAIELIYSGIMINRAVVLEVPLKTLIARANDRLVCPKCGASYTNIGNYKRPVKEGFCDKCNVQLIRRPEDNEQDVAERYNEYKDNEDKILKVLYDHDVNIVKIDSSKEYSLMSVLY